MNQEHFVRLGEPCWQAFESSLADLGNQKIKVEAEFPREFRAICRDLAFARQRQFDAHVVDRLNGLVLEAHQRFYRPKQTSWNRLWTFVSSGFPRAVREEWKLVGLCHLLFYGSALLLFLVVSYEPHIVYSIMDPDKVYDMESMYNPDSGHYLNPRSAGEDTTMFGFYIMNNISVAFRTFASGLVFGIGSLFMLIFNGILLGAVAGHLGNVGFGDTLAAFVIGHGSFELTAIIFSAAAGIQLGWAVTAPGRFRRGQALRMAARKALPLVYGSTLFLVMAAIIEAYWSSALTISPIVRFTVGSIGWLLVGVYLLKAGRKR